MIIRAFFVLAFVCIASSAQAAVGWSAAGSACTPNGATVGHYTSANAAGVTFSGSDVGSLVFTCSFDRFDSGTTDWVLKLSYRDSTGTGVSGQVLARVYKLPIGTYTPVVLKSVSSNGFNVTANNTIVSGSFNHSFDFDTNVYFVQVTLTRAASSEIVTFVSVVLDQAPPM